jgi:hypothetical protein
LQVESEGAAERRRGRRKRPVRMGSLIDCMTVGLRRRTGAGRGLGR